MIDSFPRIEDDAAHRAAMEEIDRLRGATLDAEKQDQLLALIRVAYAYERSRWASDHFQKLLTDARGLVMPERLAETLGLEIDELARLLRVSPDALRDTPTSPDAQRELRSIVEILDKATAGCLGGPQRMIHWFRFQPLDRFRNMTPAQLVATGHGDAVMMHLTLLENGIFD